MKTKHILIVLAAAFAVAGCTGTSSQRGSEKPPPKSNRVQVLMYDTISRAKTDHLDFCGANPPQRPHRVIALLTCEGAVDQEAVMTAAIHYRARQIGADAVMNAGTITTQREATVNVAQSVGDQLAMNALGLGGSRARSVFRAYAIVYTSASQDDTKISSDLLGHWASVAITGASRGVSKLEFTFLPENKVAAVSTLNTKTYPINGTYSVQSGKLAITEDKDPRTEMWDFSLVGDYLTVSLPTGEKVTLKRSNE